VAKALRRWSVENACAIGAIYSSPLQRCAQTAEKIAKQIGREVTLEPDLREYSVGELENTTFRDLAEQHGFFEQIKADPTYAPAKGESVVSVADRMIPALERIYCAHPDADNIVVVSHGAAMAIALAALIDGNPSLWTQYSFGNCSITELHLEPEPCVGHFNRTEHL